MDSSRRFRLFLKHFALLAAVLLAVAGEARALDPSKSFSQYLATTWTTQEGLAQKTVNAITQTDDGFLWLATEEGLVRYDGLSFVTFDERNAPGLGDRVIRSMVPTPGGGLWLGTSTGLVRYEHGLFSSFRKQTGFTSGIYDLAMTSDGSVWFSSDSGLHRFSEHEPVARQHLYTTADGLPSNGITGLVTAEDGTLWIGTRHGLVHYKDSHFATYPCPPSSDKQGDITSLALGRDHSVWVGMNDGSIARWSNERILPVWHGASTAGAPVWSLGEDKEGTLWIAFRKIGLGRMRHGDLELLTRANGLPSTSPDWVFEDRERNLWVGWVDMGLSMFRDGKFTVFGRGEGLSSDLISSVTKADSDALWIGTEDGGINRLSPNQDQPKSQGAGKVTASNLASGTEAMSVLQQRNGTLWLGSDHGSVIRIEKGRKTTFKVMQSLTPGVRSIIEDANGEPWFGFEMPDGLARLKDGRFEFQKVPGRVEELAMAPDGSLWIAAYGGGLIHFGNGGSHVYTERDGLANLSLTSVYVDPQGTVWAGTMLGGLHRFKAGKFTRYSIEQGLSDSTVGDVVPDKEGYLWMAGTRGIMRVSLSDLDAYAERKIDRVNTQTFGFADGLRSAECNFKAHPAAMQDEQGRLWFATLSGLAMIDPAHIRQDEVQPQPMVSELIANGHGVSPGTSGYRIKPGQNVLTLRFAAPSFVSPEQVQVRYRMVGFDNDWIHADSKQRVAPYANLSPGLYRFEVQATNSDGVGSGKTASLSFEVMPHYYETWWFRIAAIMAFAFAVWLGLRLRTQRLLRKNAELEQLILDKTTEVRAALECAEQSREMLREQALRDALTGLWNRRAIFEIFEAQMQRNALTGRPMTIIMADIDHFKSINDTWGHQAGDEVIRELSRRLSQGVRRDDAVGRYGGEELLILLDAPLDQGVERAERLREVVCGTPVNVDNVSINVTCSFGLTFIQVGHSLTETVGYADAALYRAKHEGRNCVRVQLPLDIAKAS